MFRPLLFKPESPGLLIHKKLHNEAAFFRFAKGFAVFESTFAAHGDHIPLFRDKRKILAKRGINKYFSLVKQFFYRISGKIINRRSKDVYTQRCNDLLLFLRPRSASPLAMR